MKINYSAGKYELKYRGRGVIHVQLTKSQAKALFELMRYNKLEIEQLNLIDYPFNE